MSIPCESCYGNIVRGIMHKFPDGENFICHECYEKIDPEGFYYDENEPGVEADAGIDAAVRFVMDTSFGGE